VIFYTNSWQTLCLALLLSACSNKTNITYYEDTEKVFNPLTTAAEAQSSILGTLSNSQIHKDLLAADASLISNNPEQAKNILEQIDADILVDFDHIQFILLQTRLALQENNSVQAQQWLSTINESKIRLSEKSLYYRLKSSAYTLDNDFINTVKELEKALIYSTDVHHKNIYTDLWLAMTHLETSSLDTIEQESSHKAILEPWIQLARIYLTPTDINTQLESLARWEKHHQSASFYQYLPSEILALKTTPSYNPDTIALLLPLSGPLAKPGNAVKEGFIAAYYQDKKNNEQKPTLLIYDSAKHKDPADLAKQAEMDGAQFVIGPLSRNSVEKAVVKSQILIPQLTLNYTDKEPVTSSQIYQMGISAEDEAKQCAIGAWKNGYRYPLILVPKSELGTRASRAFSKQWQKLTGNIVGEGRYIPGQDYNKTISKLLLADESQERIREIRRMFGRKIDTPPRRRQDIDVIFMVATQEEGRQLKPAFDFFFAYDIPIYSTSTIFDGKNDKDNDLNGIRFPIMPWYTNTNSALKATITQEFPQSTSQLGSLYALGVDAWHLFPRLNQMQLSERIHMPGFTGYLSVNKNKTIERRLMWYHFDNGTLLPLASHASAETPI